MAKKNAVEVIIGGKVVKISGTESQEYLHQVAVYINNKILEFEALPGYRKQTVEQRQLMLNMNLADDFFKIKNQMDKLHKELKKKDEELYGVKHEAVQGKLEIERLETEMKELRSTYEDEIAELRVQLEKTESTRNKTSRTNHSNSTDYTGRP